MVRGLVLGTFEVFIRFDCGFRILRVFDFPFFYMDKVNFESLNLLEVA